MTTRHVNHEEAAAHFGMSRATLYILKRLHRSAYPQAVGIRALKHLYSLNELEAFLKQYAPEYLARQKADQEVKHG